MMPAGSENTSASRDAKAGDKISSPSGVGFSKKKEGKNMDSAGDSNFKSKLSEAELKDLSDKLDKQMEDFMAGLEKTPYEDGWDKNKWQEEMEKHPFFMTKQPEEGEKLPPLLEGIQQLKYDPEENTPEELALSYKEDGNFNFKVKKYRKAILSYTQGLKENCKDESLNATLYNNRAASHFFIGNYRSCYNDCKKALSLKPDYKKAEIRLAEAAYELRFYDECIENCDSLLKKYSGDKTLLALRRKAVSAKATSERDKRKKAAEIRMEKPEKDKLIQALKDRSITFLEKMENIDFGTTLFPEIFKKPVHFEGTRLVWPVILMYPEYKVTDFIQEFKEDSKFSEQLEEVFSTCPSWDEEKKYNLESVNIYHEDQYGGIHRVKKNVTLGFVLSTPRFVVDRGTPIFLVLVRNSPAEKTFLRNFI